MLQIFNANTETLQLVTGQGPSQVWARPGALDFWTALSLTLGEGIKLRPGPARGQIPGAQRALGI